MAPTISDGDDDLAAWGRARGEAIVPATVDQLTPLQQHLEGILCVQLRSVFTGDLMAALFNGQGPPSMVWAMCTIYKRFIAGTVARRKVRLIQELLLAWMNAPSDLQELQSRVCSVYHALANGITITLGDIMLVQFAMQSGPSLGVESAASLDVWKTVQAALNATPDGLSYDAAVKVITACVTQSISATQQERVVLASAPRAGVLQFLSDLRDRFDINEPQFLGVGAPIDFLGMIVATDGLSLFLSMEPYVR